MTCGISVGYADLNADSSAGVAEADDFIDFTPNNTNIMMHNRE